MYEAPLAAEVGKDMKRSTGLACSVQLELFVIFASLSEGAGSIL